MANIKADDIRKALEEFYTAPEWYLGFEVGNSTGSLCRRHADAVAINAYPSKSFETRGFEIKVSKQDLRKELEQGIKSDEIARFCDYWFLVVPKGLTDDFTLPPSWGVIEYNDGKLRQKVKAEKLSKIPPTVGFMCAMMRGRERILSELKSRLTQEERENIKRQVLFGTKNAQAELDKIRTKLKEIQEQTGISLYDWQPTEEIINRLNAVKSVKTVTTNVKYIQRVAANMLKCSQEAYDAANQIYETK